VSRELNEQLLALLDEQDRRREDDALLDFKPHEKQKKFIDDILEGKVREAWALFANRAGKTEMGAWIDAYLARFGWPGKEFAPISGWIVSLDYPNSRDVVQPKIFNNHQALCPNPFIPDREIDEWRASDQILKLKNGSILGFKSADSPRVKFMGAGKDFIHFDEEPPRGHYEEATIRVEAGKKLVVFSTCTLLPPEGEKGGVSWVYNDKVRPWKKGILPEGIGIYTASIYDNPHLDRDEIKFRESIYPIGTPNRRIRLNGELIAGVGGSRAYSSFDGEVHVRKTGELNNRFPLCWCWDFNVEPLITLIGQRINGVFYVHKELIIESGNIPDMCDLFWCVYFWERPNFNSYVYIS
jgi:phage terminase large subunit-like protein